MGLINGFIFFTAFAGGFCVLIGVGVVVVLLFPLELLELLVEEFDVLLENVDFDGFIMLLDDADEGIVAGGVDAADFSQTLMVGGGAGVIEGALLEIIDVDGLITLLLELLQLLIKAAFLANIDKMSASGSFTKVEIKMWACLVASTPPLIVIERSPCVLPCFSTSIWAPVAALIALILLPPRPITLEIALTGT